MKNKGSNAIFRQIFVSIFVAAVLVFASSSLNAQSKFQLSSKERLQVFDKVWNLVNTRYYDPKMNGINWLNIQQEYKPLIAQPKDDSDFYDIIKRMVNEMNDAHTRFLTPQEARNRRARVGTTAGILLSMIDGKTVVERVLSNATGDLAKVKPGMIVQTIDGVLIKDKFNQAIGEVGGSSSRRALEILALRRIMRGKPDTYVKVGLIDKNGKSFEANLIRRIVPRKSEAIGRKLKSGIGYIAVTSFKSPISGKFKKALLKLKDTRGMIIDLRYNGGGSIQEVLKMAGYFINEKRAFGKFIRRKGRSKQSLVTFSGGKKGRQLYSKPLVILTSRFSASGSELFASSLQEFGRAKVIGDQTCGCLLGISRKHRLRGGSELHISDIGFISAKGKIYEKVGVTPDRRVKLTISDLTNDVDRRLSDAEKMIDSNANLAW